MTCTVGVKYLTPNESKVIWQNDSVFDPWGLTQLQFQLENLKWAILNISNLQHFVFFFVKQSCGNKLTFLKWIIEVYEIRILTLTDIIKFSYQSTYTISNNEHNYFKTSTYNHWTLWFKLKAKITQFQYLQTKTAYARVNEVSFPPTVHVF